MTKTYVIAGGSKGIGRSLVHLLRQEDTSIHVYSRTSEDLPTDQRLIHHSTDFSEPTVQLSDLPDQIHGAAYCPGSINLRSFRSLKTDDFQRDLDLNLLGAIRFLQACMTGLKKGSDPHPSSVVLFSTIAVQKGLPMHASVAAAKGAIEGLARSLAAEWAPKIRVNCVAPALTQTPLAERFFNTPEKAQGMAEKYPLKRTGLSEDVAAAAAFLLNEKNSWITGQVMGVDGGLSSLSL